MRRSLLKHLLLSIVFLFICVAPLVAQSSDPTADLERCQTLYNSGDYDVAIQVLTGITTTDPALAPKVLKVLGHCYSQRRMCEEGIDCYSELMRSYPDSVAPNKEVKRWMMECYIEDYKTDKALVQIQSLLGDHPQESAAYHYYTGRRHHLRSEHAEAVVEYEKAITLNTAPKEDPIVKDTKHRLIECYLATGKTDKATELFQKTLTEYPEDVGALHFIKGRRLSENGKYDDAIAELEQAVTLNTAPKNVTITKHIKRWRMVSHITKGNLENALAQLQTIIADYPKEASTFVIDERPRWKDKLPDAIAEMKKAADATVSGSSNSRYLKKGLLSCYIGSKDDVNTLLLAKAIADEFPDEAANYHAILAYQHEKQGKRDEAKVEICKALELSAGQKTKFTRDLNWWLVNYYKDQRDWTKAIPVILGMLQDYPKDTLSLERRLIYFYHADRQYEKAIPVCKDILIRFSDLDGCIDALTKLAECLYALGKGEEAITFQEEFFRQHPSWTLEADWVRARTAYHAQKDFTKATELLGRFITDYPQDPHVPEARGLLANSLVVSGQTNIAEYVLTRFTDPDTRSDVLMKMANCLSFWGKDEAAKDEICKALELSAGQKTKLTLRLNWWLVNYYTKQEDWKKVIPIAQAMLRDYPGDALKLKLRLIRAYLDDLQYEQCITACRDILTSNSEDKNACIDALTKLAESMHSLGRSTEGIAFQDEFFSQHPDWTLEADCVRARTAYYAQKDYPKAAELLSAFIAAYPNDPHVPEARKIAIHSLVISGQTDKAVEAIRQLINVSPQKDKAALTNQIGRLYFNAGKYREATDALKEELSLAAGAPDQLAGTNFMLGLCYSRLGEIDLARNHMTEVTTKYPTSKFADKAQQSLNSWSQAGQ